jgi:hypothetical protein
VIFTTQELADGTRVRLRLARPSDKQAVQAFFEDAPELAVHRLTYYDPHERLTLVALTFEDGAEQVVGLADVALRGGRVDEIVVTARDDLRRQGLDTLLTEAVAYTRLSRAPLRRRAA